MAAREIFVNTNQSQNLANGLQKCLATTWEADDPFSDVDVIVEGSTFRCHKYILNATSGYFQDLFRRDQTKPHENRLELKMMPKAVFEVIAKALYTGVPGLTKDNFQEVWRATQLLQIHHLCDECENFALHQVKDGNCVELYYFAKSMNATKVANCANTFMIFGFEAMIQSEGFLQMMTPDLFSTLLEKQYLNVSNEDVVVDSILKWVFYHPEKTQKGESPGDKNDTTIRGIELGKDDLSDTSDASFSESATANSDWEMELKNYLHSASLPNGRVLHLPRLLRAAKLLLVSVKCLKLLIRLNIADISTECQAIMREAVTFSSQHDANHCAWKNSATHRFSSKLEHAVVILTEGQLNVYRMEYPHNVSRVAWIPRRAGMTFESMIVFKNTIYIEGVTTLYNTLLTLDEEKNWRDFIVYSGTDEFGVNTTNPTKLFSHNRSLYRFRSGVLFRLIEVPVDTFNPTWVEVYRSENIVAANEIVSFENFILFFTHTRRDAVVYGLDTETKLCRRMSNLIGGAWCMISFNDGSSTYILQSCGTLLRIINNGESPVSFQFVSHLWDCEWIPMLAVTYLNKLVIFGKDLVVPLEVNTVRRSLPGLFDCIEMVKLEEGHQCYPMTVPRQWFTENDSSTGPLVTITVPRHWLSENDNSSLKDCAVTPVL